MGRAYSGLSAFLLVLPRDRCSWPGSSIGAMPGSHWAVTDPSLSKTGLDGRPIPTQTASFTHLIAFDAPRLAALSMIRPLLPRLEPLSSSVVLGTDAVVFPGTGPHAAAAVIRRRRDLSRPEMLRYWSEQHADLARGAGGLGYRQVHVDLDRTAEANRSLGLHDPEVDGIAFLYFSDSRRLQTTRASSPVAVDATADETRFLDHARSQFVSLSTQENPTQCG
jgi:hypothetical protein